jgi:hypothetical protein
MQHFDEDMGELFRKASSDIRLRPPEDEWDKIQERLLPDFSVLPASTPKHVYRSTVRVPMLTLFMFGIAAMTFLVLTDYKTEKKEKAVRPGILQQEVNARKSDIENDQTGRNTKGRFALRSSAPVLSESAFAEGHLRVKSLNGMVPFGREEQIQVGLNAKSKPSVQVFDFRQDTGDIQTMDKKNEKQKKPGGKKWIYGGIIAGPQFSQTKQQGFGNAGISGGLIAGLHLNKRLSVETGLVISDKQYSSSGRYFDMSKISASMPAGMKLMQIQSRTTVLEIPLELRYNLAGINKGNLFAAGGFSSYIITREMNQYLATVNGNDETFNGSYPAHQDYFAATAKIAAGYEWKAGKGLNLRVEPYLQIPLKTIGMGSMHVVSAGIYLGITFPLVK